VLPLCASSPPFDVVWQDSLMLLSATIHSSNHGSRGRTNLIRHCHNIVGYSIPCSTKKENIQKQSTAPLRVNSLPVTLLLVVAAVWQIFDSNGTLYMKEESHSCCTCKSSETCSRPTPDCSCFAWKGFSPLLEELWSVGFLWEMRVNSQWISSDVSHNISCWCRGHIPRHTLMPFVYLCICYTRLLDALSDGFQDWWLAGLDVRCLRIALVVRTILSLQRQRCKLPCEFFS